MTRIGNTLLLPYRFTQERGELLLRRLGEGSYVRFDPALGWTLSSATQSRSDPRMVSDAQGLRAPERGRVVPETPLPGWLPRVEAFGDSYTHGDEAVCEDTWPSRLESLLAGRGEVLNFGVPAYGTDQAYLRWRTFGTRFHPRAVILAVHIDDILRDVNLYRWFLAPETGIPLAKPRLVVDSGDPPRWIQVPVPPPEAALEALSDFESHPLRSRAYWYVREEHVDRKLYGSRLVCWILSQRAADSRLRMEREAFRQGSDPLKVTTEIVRRFCREALAEGSSPLVAVLPGEHHLRSYRKGDVYWQPLLDALREISPSLLDATPFLAAASEEGLFASPDGHYARAGNEIVARAMASAWAGVLP